jgi:putative Mg2+ transporter-C (MgtC) family protein
MMPMSSPIDVRDAILRLGLTVLAGILLGYNRSQHGKAAGMRTMLLVCLAASVAMIQVNILLAMAGRPHDSFVMNDLMRLPLGILTGVGFIGGGAILHRDNLVVGVTTAATIWLGTVIGLCLGGGQIALGIMATLLGLFALWVLKWVEGALRHEQLVRLVLTLGDDGPSEGDIRGKLQSAAFLVVKCDVSIDVRDKCSNLEFELREFRRRGEIKPPDLVGELARAPGILKVQWCERD